MSLDLGAMFYREANPNESVPRTGCGLIVQESLASSDPHTAHPFIMPNTHSDVLIYARDDRFPEQNRSVVKRLGLIVRPTATVNGQGMVGQPPKWDDPTSTIEEGIEKVLGIYYFGRTFVTPSATPEDLIQEMIQEPVETHSSIVWADLMAGSLLSEDQYFMPWLQNLMYKDTCWYDAYRFDALRDLGEAIHDAVYRENDNIVRLYEAHLKENYDGQPCVAEIRTVLIEEDVLDVVIPQAYLHRRLV